MIVIGLAGLQGVGKDTIADYLRRRYGFVKFAFSDALYTEVQKAFSLMDQSLLRDRSTKDAPQSRLVLENCLDEEFVGVAVELIEQADPSHHHPHQVPLSPRQILQWWGTDYRRARDQKYWLRQAAALIFDLRARFKYAEHRPHLFVETGTRFENERQWVKGFGGTLWHVHRDGVADITGHISAHPLPVMEGERQIWNNDTIEHLYEGVDLLMRTDTPFVRVEPIDVAPETANA